MSEVKFSTADVGDQITDSATATFGTLPFVFNQGVDRYDNRIGDSIKMKFLRGALNIGMRYIGIPTRFVHIVRFTIFHMKVNPAASLPVLADVYDAPVDARNWVNQGINTQSASVIFDRKAYFGDLPNLVAGVPQYISGAQLSQIPSNRIWKWGIKQRNKVNFRNNGVTTLNDPKDIFYFCIVTSEITAGIAEYSYRYATRLSFYDM